jgi:hypothetical protein
MDTRYMLVALVVLFAGAIYGIFRTKTEGFGKYTTSVLILTLTLFVSTLALVLGKIDSQPFMSLLFAVAGYAGGLVTGKASST